MIPESFRGKRVFLRFDAVHGGTHYWLGRHYLGYGENLYTPVEFVGKDKNGDPEGRQG